MTITFCTLLMFLVVLTTGSLVYFFTDFVKRYSQRLTLFGGAIVSSLIFVHILPEIYNYGNSWLGVFLVLGLVTQVVSEQLTGGLEHGHSHGKKIAKSKTAIIGLLVGLGVHSLVEGMPIAYENHVETKNEVDEHVSCEHDQHERHQTVINAHAHAHVSINDGFAPFFTSVLIHKVPVTIVLSLFVLASGVYRWKYFILVLIFAIMTPIGILLGNIVGEEVEGSMWLGGLKAFSTGMLLHIITNLFFDDHSSKFKLSNILILIAGISLGTALFLH